MQATIECGFTLKPVHDMTRTYSQRYNIQIFWTQRTIVIGQSKRWTSADLETC